MTDTRIINEIIYTETEKRLRVMRGAEYNFPAPLRKSDRIGIAMGIFAASMLLVLCMIGVIGE